ncbi:unnamed protein product [Mesocestoides corti]|uniref:IPT/TIG domain-containing protein n=1 Tax=Mesocestoides corti TaxID=53468 RepID=A0A0R3UHP5_MESCO|nr:unnamed protein product [Mesocestoides corti]
MSKVWTEHRDRTGAINFITGAGGFLQAVVNGFAGIRVCTPAISGVNVPALFINPKLTIPTLSEGEPERNVLHIQGISFLGRKLDGIHRVVTITLESGNPVVVIRANPSDPSEVNMDEQKVMRAGKKIDLKNQLVSDLERLVSLVNHLVLLCCFVVFSRFNVSEYPRSLIGSISGLVICLVNAIF